MHSIPNKLLLTILCLSFYLYSFAQTKDGRYLNIVFIGNSITQGVLIDSPQKNAPPVKTCVYLQKQPGIGIVRYSNQGVSGKTTVDFLPATNTLFPEVTEVANQFKNEADLIFSVMIGTNDSAIKGPNGAPVSPQQYYTNLKVILDELLRLYPQCKIILHRPIWYSPNTYNSSMYLKAGLERLESYLPQLEALADNYASTRPKQVYIGDTEAFDYFRKNYTIELIPEEGNAGTFYLHPNEQGAASLGEFWGKAIYRILTTNE